MSYIFNMLICVRLILLDNLLQCLLFIAMIDLSRTCGTAASLICYTLVMIIIQEMNPAETYFQDLAHLRRASPVDATHEGVTPCALARRMG
jgi:hypothetical protein